MAAEVPAKDVLCEAMEYLSKLGSNLRKRSENLKDKKIRREKLNNVLAVQKAANKVLLICELSKKSLENVETGVRKVLKYIDTSQISSHDGAKTPKSIDGSESKNYYYFEYKSRKLRIKKRISLKHYTSVRVMAKSLPKSMIAMYPVHYDCKLYRMRQREKRLCEESCEHDTEKIVQKESSAIKGNETIEKVEKSKESNMSVISIPDTPSPKSKVDNNFHEHGPEDKDMSVISIPDTPRSKSVDERGDKANLSPGNDEKKSKNHVGQGNSKERSHSRDSYISPRKDGLKSSGEKKESRRNSSDQFDSGSKSNKKNDKKKVKRRIIADSSDDDKKSDIEPEPKKRKLSETINKELNEDSNDNNEDAMKLDEENSDKEQNGDPANDSKKPMIKCVSLSKLLKPSVLIKDDTISHKAKGSPKSKAKSLHKEVESVKVVQKQSEEKEKMSEKIDQKQRDGESTKAEKLALKCREEEEYWLQKRKEVSVFEAKSFVINITRLPEITVDFMNKLSLRKITKFGCTLCEIDVSEEINVNNKTPKPLSNKTRQSLSNDLNDDELIAEANKVKNSLLNESDTDCDAMAVDNQEKNLSNEKNTDNIKSALLNSDSDNSSEKVSNPAHTKPKGGLLLLYNDLDSASKKSKSKTQAAQAELKNKLLDESDSSTDSKKPKKTTQQEEENKKNSGSELEDKSVTDAKASQTEKDASIENAQPKELDITANNKSDSDSANKKHSDLESVKDETNNDRLLEEKDNDKNDEDSNSKQQDENNLESPSQINEKTPEKESPVESDDKIKTPLSQRITPQSKKKRLRESVHAKKMLLTYSSSDTEDEQLNNALKEIKHALLNGSDEENSPKKQEEKLQSRNSSTSSGEDILQKTKEKRSKEKNKHIRKKHRRKLDTDSDSNNSKSSSSKMVRSKSKPGNSSSQNSDAPDSNDKDIDGLTNLNTLTKTRRRHSNSSDMTEEASANTRSRRLKIKPTGLICDEMLKAESSSDDASASGEENLNNDDDLPPVTLPSFNGGGEHLVKEDLLGESDSSVSQNDSANKDDSDDEGKLNSRRRKQLAISSDSEVGSSRKKDADVRLSDFEDSDDSDLTKRSKRKKKANDSDGSVASNSSNEGGKKKRRRIKSVRDSDASGSESENEGRNKHGRKNIRKVMGKNQLEEATKKAARQEKERIARIAERQKTYNNMQFDESGKPDEVVLDKVILDFEPETKEPLIEVDRGLVKKLKPHQANGIKFMWDACFESVKRIKKDKGSGCILAHCMGLGKTLQVVSLTHTLLTHSDLTKVNRVLVVCPLSTVLNWVNEFRMWLKHAVTENDVDVYELSRYKQNSERAFQLSQWFQYGGVCVLGYEMFRNLSADNVKKFKKKMLKNFQEALVDPGPDLVVCDEGHLLKNEKTSLSQSMNRVKTLRRIVLTGTPLQNNLKEYYCMVQFVKPNLLGKYNEYLNRFVNPITNGQYTDSTEHDIKIMKRRSHVLHTMLDGAVQRRDYGVLAPFLPPKHEYVLFITLSEVQVKLYQHYLDNYSRRPQPGKSSGFLFPDFQSLQRIWTHPLVLKYNSERYEIMQQKKRDKEEEDSEGSLVDFIDDDSTPDESSSEESTDDSSDMSDDSRKKSKKKKSAKKGKGKDKEAKGDGQSRPRRGTRANPLDIDAEEKDDDIIEVKNENPTEWWIKLVAEAEIDDMRNSHKLVLLFDILRQCETIGDKLLVFSQSLYSLDLIEHFLGKVDEATQEGRIDEKLGGHVGSWSPGVDYFRLDGSTSCENRSIWCKNFNREDNPRARLFLISTRAGGLGINLVAANRVVIFDVSWNPSHDVQSIFRVYRFGQKKPCYVYRFLAMGTMEEKIYERQVTKQAISKRVIDEQQIDRHYAENDLAELYKFEPQPPVPRPIPPLPKDRLFAEMLREHEVQIYKYHEHDSLLENKEEETLSEEERKAAWEDFENEKNKPPPAPFPSPWPMHNGMVPGLLAQQQQQLAYAALAGMLRKDMPNLSDNQLRDMLPLIYAANPQMFGGYDYGLMQKMSEMYKYPQASMMNPGMMNPVMNAAGAGGMSGMSGASGLQYEPPWQRQQQQQQQMRLQQLMQQQNQKSDRLSNVYNVHQQMGAKYYAGGLGSRDPVAMALQQQQARQIMLGNNAAAAAARPRGRPPLQPRAPHPPGDVVNLDSD